MRAPDPGGESPGRAFSPELAALVVPGLLAAATSAGAQEARSVPDPITATVDLARTGPPIDPLLYMFRHTDVWAMSAYTALTSVLAYDRTDADPTLRATGLLSELYTERLGTVPVAVVDGNSPQPELPGTVGVDKPAESSGSPTYPLDVLAALSEDGSTLAVAVANPSESRHTLQLEFRGGTPRGGRVWTLASPELDARAAPGGEPVSTASEAAVTDAGAPLTVPAAAIQLYELRLE